MNDDAPAAQLRGVVSGIALTHLFVTPPATAAVQDLDAEAIGPVVAQKIPIDGGQQEPEASGPVDSSGAFELRSRSGDHEPLIRRAVEIQARCIELELRVAAGDVCALLVFGYEAEGGLPG